MRSQRHSVGRIVGGIGALVLGLALVGLGPALGLGHAPTAHAGSGGGSGGDTKYVLKVKERTVLAAYQVVAADGCTVTEVSITAGEDLSRQVPAPSTRFGPAAMAVVTHYNQCTGETLFAGGGFTDQNVSVSIANSLNTAQLATTIPVTSLDAPPDSPPTFFVTIPSLAFTATGPPAHTVQSQHFNMHGANLVENLNAARAPATTEGAVVIGDYATASTANLLIAEIDNYHSGTTSVSKS